MIGLSGIHAVADRGGTTPEINDINITVSGVEKLLSKLNPTKAAALDNITPRVLKELAPFIAPILTDRGYCVCQRVSLYG
jgi:hypothetical protein